MTNTVRKYRRVELPAADTNAVRRSEYGRIQSALPISFAEQRAIREGVAR